MGRSQKPSNSLQSFQGSMVKKLHSFYHRSFTVSASINTTQGSQKIFQDFQAFRIQGFQRSKFPSPRLKGFKVFRGVQGFQVFSRIFKADGFFMFQGFSWAVSESFHGKGIGRPILACIRSSIHLNAPLYSEAMPRKVPCTSNACACTSRWWKNGGIKM